MKIEKIHLIQPDMEKASPIDQKEKMVLWGRVASVCLTKPYNTNEKFYECLDVESKKHLN